MASSNKPLTEEQIKVNFRNYERHASYTMEKLAKELEQLFRNIVSIPIMTIGLALFIFGKRENGFIYLTISMCGIILGIAAGKIVKKTVVDSVKNNMTAVDKIERTEGYTQRFFDEMNNVKFSSGKISDKVANQHYCNIALAYDMCGEPFKAIEKLKSVDAKIYTQNPSGGEIYYSAVLIAYLLAGDLDHAADAYNKGFYYLNTYKNSPMHGSQVSLALGIYEFYCGHYGVSLQLLENAVRIGHADVRPENRIPDENMSSVICYWKAMNFAAMGDKASAWEMIDYCKNFYKTPYYEQLSQKLLEDMEKDGKNHKDPEMITDVETFS